LGVAAGVSSQRVALSETLELFGLVAMREDELLLRQTGRLAEALTVKGMRSAAVQLLRLAEQGLISQLGPGTGVIGDPNVALVRRQRFQDVTPGRHLEGDFDVRMSPMDRGQRLIEFRTDNVSDHAD